MKKDSQMDKFHLAFLFCNPSFQSGKSTSSGNKIPFQVPSHVIMSRVGKPQCTLIVASQNEELTVQWIRSLSEICQIFRVSSIDELRQNLKIYKPAIAFLDFDLPGLDSGPGISALVSLSPTTRLIIFANQYDELDAIAVLKAGARGYEQKETDWVLVRKAIEVVRKGELWIRRDLVKRLLTDIELAERENRKPIDFESGSAPVRLHQLTAREQQIAYLVGSAYSNKEIGALLKISESTVKAHLSAIYHKLGLLDRLSLALFVTRRIPRREDESQTAEQEPSSKSLTKSYK